MDDNYNRIRNPQRPYPSYAERYVADTREYISDNNISVEDSIIQATGSVRSFSPLPSASTNYLVSEPSSSNNGPFPHVQVEQGESDEAFSADVTDESIQLAADTSESVEGFYQEGEGFYESLDESNTTEDESVVDDEIFDNVDFELEDVSDDEESFLGYCPVNIPPLIEEDMGELLEPIWKSFKKTIEKPIESPQKPQTFQDNKPDSHTAEMSELQFNIETLFKTNLFMQMTIIDELSKLMTGNSAVVGGRSKMPEIEETLKEELPSVHTKMNMNLTSCLKKDQNKLYLVELWWAWIEDLMSDISSDYFKKFRNVMIEKLKPKAFSEDDPSGSNLHSSPTKLERNTELKSLGVPIYDLQTIEDYELPSDYEDDLGPIYYKRTERESLDVGDADESVLQNKRKGTVLDSPPPAKRHRSDSNATKEGDTTQHSLVLSRRISTLSHQSSMSPPVLSPAIKQNQTVPHTPMKDVSSFFSSPPHLVTNQAETILVRKLQKKETRRRKKRKAEKSSTMDLKYPHTREREIPNEDEEDSANWQKCSCDSDDIESEETIPFTYDSTNQKESASLLTRKNLQERENTDENSSDESNISSVSSESTEKVRKRKPRERMTPLGLESEWAGSSCCSFSTVTELDDYSALEESGDDVVSTPDQEIFIHNGFEFEGEILQKLIKAGIINVEEDGQLVDTTENEHIFGGKKQNPIRDEEMDNVTKEMTAIQNQLTHLTRQTQQQSKILYEYMMCEGERKQCLRQLGEMESTLIDNLEGPVGEADTEVIVENFKKLTMVYEAQDIYTDKVEDLNIEHVASRALNLDNRFY